MNHSSKLRHSMTVPEMPRNAPPPSRVSQRPKFVRSQTQALSTLVFPPVVEKREAVLQSSQKATRELKPRPATTQSKTRVPYIKQFRPHRGCFMSSTYDSTAAAVLGPMKKSWPSPNFNKSSGRGTIAFRSRVVEITATLRQALIEDPLDEPHTHYLAALDSIAKVDPGGYGSLLAEIATELSETIDHSTSVSKSDVDAIVAENVALRDEITKVNETLATLTEDRIAARRQLRDTLCSISQIENERDEAKAMLDELVGKNPAYVEQRRLQQQMEEMERQMR